MEYRRLFIVRKDLNLSAGKLAAQLSHCAEAYWLHLIRDSLYTNEQSAYSDLILDKQMVDGYILGKIIKTICEARNKNHLLKARELANEAGLVEGKDYGFIYDLCLTELEPEEENGTTLTAFWTGPLPTETAHKISKKYHLLIDRSQKNNQP